MPLTLLVLAPHPDDAEWFAGGTIARMARDGARVLLAIATDGRCGSFECDSETPILLRREEARRAAEVLGAGPPILLDHPDFELDTLPAGRLREEFIRLIRQHRPDVVIAQDAFTPDVHPDHRACAWAAAEAIAFASLPLVHVQHLAEGLLPHAVVEKYFYTEDLSRADRLVDITEALSVKVAAMAEHKSQVTFLAEGVLEQVRQAGLDPRALLGEAADDPLAAITFAIEARAAEAGRRLGVRYAEAFRYERFHPLVESLLAGSGGVEKDESR